MPELATEPLELERAELGPSEAGPRGRRRRVLTGVGILAAIALLGILIPAFSSYGTDELVAPPLQAPSLAHPFGTDELGRDVFVRTWAAARIDLFVALVGVTVPLLFGTVVGVAVGSSRRRWVDSLVMRIVDAILAFPFVILILALVVVLGTDTELGPLPAGLPSLFAGLFVVAWTYYARLARAQTLSLRDRDYVAAARLLGYSRWRIIRHHLIPNVFATTATYAISDAMLVIVLTASLPFLGAGVQPPTPEWGAIMYEGRTSLALAPWISIAPGLVIAATGIAIAMIAGALLPERRSAGGSPR